MILRNVLYKKCELSMYIILNNNNSFAVFWLEVVVLLNRFNTPKRAAGRGKGS